MVIRPKLLGGKGGFGSLLKNQKPTRRLTSNFDACRDLSGRRLRHIFNEKKLKEWLERQEEEEKKIEEELEKYKKQV